MEISDISEVIEDNNLWDYLVY